MKTGHLIAIFAVALLAALAAAFGTWYLQEEEGASAAEGGAHIAVEESVDLLFGQSTVLSPVLIGEDGSIRSDAVFEFSCADEADAAYLKFDNVQQGKVTAVGYKEEPIAVRIVNQEYGVQTEVQVNIEDVLGEVLSVQCAAGSVHYGEDVVLRADVLPRGCDLSDNLAFAVFTEAGEKLPVGEAFSDIEVTCSTETPYSHVITLRACAVGSGRLELSVSYDGEEGAGAGLPRADAAPGGAEEAYAGSFDFDISVEDAAIGSALVSAADADEDGFAAQSEIAAVRRIAVAAAADFSVLDLFPSVEEVFLPAEALTHAYGLPASGEVRFYVPSALLSAYLADSVWSAAERNIFPQAAAEEGSVIAVLHSEYGTPLAAVDLSAGQLPVYAHTGYTHTGWSTEEGGDPVDAEEIEHSVHLYALWRANTYTVRFVGNDNDGGSMEEQTFTYDVPAALAKNAFTRTGYTFVGWTRFGGGTVYADEQEVLNLTAEDGGTVGLYAVWEANTYTVTFDYGTGTGDTQSIKVTYDEPYGELPEAVLAGYIGIWTLDGKDIGADTVVTTARNHTLTARYKGNELKLTLEYDGKEETRIVTHGEPYGELPAGEGRTGHTLRWYTEKDGGEEVAAETAVAAIESHTLYGRYVPNTYTVTFDYGEFAGADDPVHREVTYGSVYGALPAGSREGYVVAWRNEAGETVTAETIVTSTADHTLEAVWTPVQYTVIFSDGYSAGGTEQEQSFVYDEAQALAPVQYSREGYDFLGWAAECGAASPEYEAGETVKNLSAEQGGIVRLYAVWQPYSFRVTVYPCYPDSSETGEGIAVTLLRDQLLSAPDFDDVVGYSVAGFSTQQFGPTEWALGTAFDYDGEDGSEVALYAVWRANTYTVRFDGNGSDGGSMQGQAFAYDVPALLSPCGFTKTGYSFAGWAIAAGGDVVAYEEEEEVSKLTPEDGGIVPLYAVWRANTYTVAFDANGGTGSMGEQSFVYGEAQALHAHMFTRTGYTFVGWARTAGGSASYRDGETVSNLTPEDGDTVSLYAVWRANTYTVTFDYGDGSGEVGSKTVTYKSTYGDLPVANKTGYEFIGWTTEDGEKVDSRTEVTTARDHTLVAVYTPLYTVTISASHVTVTVTRKDTGETVQNGGSVPAGTVIQISCTANTGYENATCTPSGTYTVTDNVTITASATKVPEDSCFAKGTMIMLGDGSVIAVENIKAGDRILAFDHLTGSYVESEVAYTYRAFGMVDVVKLSFSDGSEIEFVNTGHGIFDVTLNRYVLIGAENVDQFVGHEFYYTEYHEGIFVGRNIYMTSYSITKTAVERYDLVTEKTLNCIANNLLVCSDVLVGVSNTFNFADDLKYNHDAMLADIEKYGLFEYEEWAEYLSPEDFEKFNGAYFKVALGKGLITMEEIFELLNDLAIFWAS